MAIDILIYQSNIVPVGRDQKQHVEMTRDLALKFNRTFGETFTIPEPSILPGVETIRGLDGQKMSKSYDNTIELFAEEKALRKKVMSIVTDSTPVEAPKDPANSAIVEFYRLFASEKEVTEMENRFRAGGTGYGDFKKQLFRSDMELTSSRCAAAGANLEAIPGYVEQGAGGRGGTGERARGRNSAEGPAGDGFGVKRARGHPGQLRLRRRQRAQGGRENGQTG